MSETLTMPSRDQIDAGMRAVIDPELGVNIVDLGLIYDARADEVDGEVVVTLDMTLTSAACPLSGMITDDTVAALTTGPAPLASDVRINWVWMPPWGPDKITDAGREQFRAMGFNW